MGVPSSHHQPLPAARLTHPTPMKLTEEVLHEIISGQDTDHRYCQFLMHLLKTTGFERTVLHMSEFITYLSLDEIEEAVLEYIHTALKVK